MSDVGAVREMTTMKATCPSCGSVFPVDPLRVPPQGILAICTACLRTFPVLRPREAFEVPGAHGDADAASWTMASPAPQAATPPQAPAQVDPPAEVISRWDAHPEVAAEEGPGPDAPKVPAEEEAGAASARSVTPQEPAAPVPVEEMGTAEAIGEERVEEAAAEPLDEAPDHASEQTPQADSGPAVPPAREREDAPAPRAFGGSAGAPTGVAAGAARFGSRDPSERARRLARVLASDMITYNPARYADARKSGTLVEDFRDEIEKSWEEYVDQVGGEMARETTHFVDALNEVLARGETLFQGPGFPYDDPPA